jgi:dolichol-phosphate mannosyltransferase
MNSQDPQKISVVVPVHNEAGNIRPLFDEIRSAMAGAGQWEVIFSDDGSTDSGVAEMDALCRSEPRCRVIRLASCCGQSTALALGIRNAQGHWIATLDGDGQNDPADIPSLLAVARQSDEVNILVNGHRIHRQDNWLKRISSKTANSLRSKLLKDHTPDTGCGLKVFRKESFLNLPYFDHMHRFLPALFLRAGGIVESLPVNHRPRSRGKSKYGMHNRLWIGMIDLLGVRWLIRRSYVPKYSEVADDAAITSTETGADEENTR